MPAEALEKLVDRAGSLYSLPTVAMEVVRLTGQKNVDTRALKEAIEADPALVAKTLRVVNSSLFGLSGEVANLNQALALLGVEPLKLLVLSFSLPDRLFANLAADELRGYWTNSLTRAVAARDIARSWFADRAVSGDDAFIAGLLRDIGSLLLIQELGDSYLGFLRRTAGSSVDPLRLERASLGFDRLELSASLLESWKLPAELLAAFGTEDSSGAEVPLREVLRLADLVTQLVNDQRLEALPRLVECGQAACGLTEPMLNELIDSLKDKVSGVAEALRVEISQERDYSQVLVDAHAQMSAAVAPALEAAAEDAREIDQLSDDDLSEQLLAESHELRLATRAFLRGGNSSLQRAEGAHPPKNQSRGPSEVDAERLLQEAVEKLSARCRREQSELSIALVTLGGVAGEAGRRPLDTLIDSALRGAELALESGRAVRLPFGGSYLAVLMPGVDRRGAVAFCQRFATLIGDGFEDYLRDGEGATWEVCLHAGVASIAQVPNRFESRKLIEGAQGCLSAAQSAAGGAVKSIEVY